MKLITWFRHKIASIPMQVGLIVIMISAVFIGLLTSYIALNNMMHSYLVSRVDNAISNFSRTLEGDSHVVHIHNAPQGMNPFYIRITDHKGTLLFENKPIAETDYPRVSLFQGHDANVPFTVESQSLQGSPWRVIKRVTAQKQLYVGMGLTQTQRTTERLHHAEILVSIIVLLIVGIMGSWLIRRNLRPLQHIERSALQIASGHHGVRIPEGPPSTEVGRLSLALNSMLSQLQESLEIKAQSEEQMRESSEKLRRFIADVSHELRTPLTSIRGFAELYRQGASSDPDWVLQRIETESLRMSSIVEDLLTLARTGIASHDEKEKVDVLEVVRDRIIAIEAMSPQRHIKMGLRGDYVPIIYGVRGHLAHIISNYLSNAVYHTPEETPIEVQLTTTEDTVRVDVIDQGPGIAEEEHKRVFERFYRTDASRARVSGGSGLGLSIAQMFARSMDGEVGLESALGEGSDFWVTLPRVE